MARPKRRVVIVDQNEERLSILRFMLTSKGYTVLAAATAEQAAADHQECELVIGCWPCGDVAALARRRYGVPSLVLVDKLKDIQALRIPADRALVSAAPWEIVETVHVMSARKRGPKSATVRMLMDGRSEVA